jgi:hypothetical protein
MPAKTKKSRGETVLAKLEQAKKDAEAKLAAAKADAEKESTKRKTSPVKKSRKSGGKRVHDSASSQRYLSKIVSLTQNDYTGGGISVDDAIPLAYRFYVALLDGEPGKLKGAIKAAKAHLGTKRVSSSWNDFVKDPTNRDAATEYLLRNRDEVTPGAIMKTLAFLARDQGIIK